MTDQKDNAAPETKFDLKWLKEDLDFVTRENERLKGELAAPQFIGEMGPLFESLAKAQAMFEPIFRTREVEVRPKDGRPGYNFAYAPLDEVLRCTGKGLTENGLTIFQLLAGGADGGKLTTILGHSSGARIVSVVVLPPTDSAQKWGSVVTYSRRYAIVCLLGVASEEDDDGAAPGTQAVAQRNPAPKAAVVIPPKAAPKPAAKKPDAPAAMTTAQYEAIGEAFSGIASVDVPGICQEVVGKAPPEDATATSGWTSDDAEKLLAHLRGGK